MRCFLQSRAVVALGLWISALSVGWSQSPVGSGALAGAGVATRISSQDVPSVLADLQLTQAIGPACGVSDPNCGVAVPACGLPSCDDCSAGGSPCGDGGITFGGWWSFGYHSEGNDLFNSRPDEFALHQGWLYLEQTATEAVPVGFRADLMYGLDANDTQAFGNDPGHWDFDNGYDHGSYGWAIPQLYVELLLGDWSVKAGHFYTLIGYEVVTAPDNFFYSHAITMYNSEPFTHTGVVATRSLNDYLEIYAGWTLGWDTGFDRVNNGSSWLGGFSLTATEDITFTYVSTAGNFGARGDEAYSHSLVFDVTMTENLNWVVQSDVLRIASTGEDNVGINQYFLYTVNDNLGLGARVEWWKADNITGYAPHDATLPGDGSFSYYAFTAGANLSMADGWVLRPEIRCDWSPAANYDETYFGIDGVYTF